MRRIDIANKLVIQPDGIILIPGSEPLSVVSSPSIYAFNDRVETIYSREGNSYITVKKALEVIPGSWVLIAHPNYYYRYFVLPEGPPTPGNVCCKRIEDYYQILRDNADVGPFDDEDDTAGLDHCSGFDFGNCAYNRNDYDVRY